MASGPISYPTNAPVGLSETIQMQGHSLHLEGNVWMADDAQTVQALIDSYVGSAAELAWHKSQKQIALDALFDANFDLAKFIRGGTVTTITAAQVGGFLAQIANNYRSLRASIANASTVAAVDGINIASGWPSNP